MGFDQLGIDGIGFVQAIQPVKRLGNAERGMGRSGKCFAE